MLNYFPGLRPRLTESRYQAHEMEPVAETRDTLSPKGAVQETPPMTLSEAIDRIGSGPFQTRLVMICGMGWVVDAMEILVVTFVLEDIAITFGLSSVEKGLIGSSSFLGMVLGASFWSIYADRRGRRSAFVQSLALVFVAGILSALSPSLIVLCLCRVVVGFGVGGNMPVTTSLVTELLPTSERATVMCRVAGTMWGTGMIFASLLGLLLANVFGPGQEEAMWRWFLGLAALPSAMVAVAYKFLPESPRFLQVMGRHDEARQVLEDMARVNGKLDVVGLGFSGQVVEEGEAPCRQVPGIVPSGTTGPSDGYAAVLPSDGHPAHRGEAEEAEAGDFRELFHTPILRRITLCLWVVWFTKNVSYYGLTFLLPRYCKDISGGGDEFIYILSAVVGVTFIFAGSIAMWLCSGHRLGRVGALKWSALATAAAFFLLIATLRVKAIFAAASLVTLFSTAIPSIILYTFTPELYNTKYRTVGLGSASVVTRIGGILAPLLAEILYDKGGPAVPLLVFGPLMIVAAVAGGMIPIETAGRQLDDDSWDRQEPADDSKDMLVLPARMQ
ncbi:unnamed protein product [Pylaiella littoralis]